MFDTLWRDIRYAARTLRRTPAFSCAAVLSLAFGIGATTAVFNVVDSVLLRPLPVPEPNQLVLLSTHASAGTPAYHFSFNVFRSLQQQSSDVINVAAAAPLQVSVEADGQQYATATGQMVSGNYFSMLQLNPAAGRLLTRADDQRGGAGVAVLGHRYWQQQFGGRSDIIGKLVRLNGEAVTIVGVVQPQFYGTHVGERVDIMVPLSLQPRVYAQFASSLIDGPGGDDLWLELMGRLPRGMSLVAARPRLEVLYTRVRYPGLTNAAATDPTVRQLGVESGSRGLSDVRTKFSAAIMVLMAVVAGVLLIACANVANLLLARAANRRREIAVRVALGASRRQLVRQLFGESLLLALLGGACGLLLAYVSRATLAGLLVQDHADAIELPITSTVFAFTVAVSVITAFIFGLMPAFSVSRVRTFTVLKDAARQVPTGRSRFTVRNSLVVAQVALSLILLVGAGLFVRTLMNLRNVDLGFEQDHLIVLHLEPRGSNQKTENEGRLRQVYGSLLTRVRAVPGVTAASLSGMTPFGGDNYNQVTPSISVAGYVPGTGEDMRVRITQVYPQYFATMGARLLAGRDLTPVDDSTPGPRVAVINAEMAHRFFGSPGNAIGRRFNVRANVSFEIIGVVANVQDMSLRDPVRAVAYSTYAHTPTGRGQMTLFVRTATEPIAVISTIRRLAHDADSSMPLQDVRTVAQRVASLTRQEGLIAILSGVFGALALLLAVIGLYGLMSYTVARRQEEFGLRLALGASPAGLKRLVLRDTLVIVTAGVAVGIAVTTVVADQIAAMLYGVQPFDPTVFSTAIVTLIACAVIAAYVSARNVSRLDPLVALRGDA